MSTIVREDGIDLTGTEAGLTFEQLRADFCAAADVDPADFTDHCERAASRACVGRTLMAERMRAWFIEALRGQGIAGSPDRLRPRRLANLLTEYDEGRVWCELLGLAGRGQ